MPFLNSLKGVALGDHPDDIGWVDFYSDSNKTNQQLYLLSFYYVFTTMSTVGYGDITPHLYMEYVFSLWNMFVGTIVFGAPAPAPPVAAAALRTSSAFRLYWRQTHITAVAARAAEEADVRGRRLHRECAGERRGWPGRGATAGANGLRRAAHAAAEGTIVWKFWHHFRELEWKTPIFSWRAVLKAPNAS